MIAAVILAIDDDKLRWVVITAFIAITGAAVMLGWHVGFTRQVFAFELEMVVSLLDSEGIRWPVYAGVGGGSALACCVDRNFAYALFSNMLLMSFLGVKIERIPYFVAWVSEYSYEIFLIHGMFFVFFGKVLGFRPLETMVVPFICIALGAIALKSLSGQIAKSLDAKISFVFPL